jgi:hypothetical protein
MAAWDRGGFARLLRAELTKFRTVRGWMIALCAAAVVFVLLAFLSAFASRSGNVDVPTGPDGEAVTDTYMFVHQTLAGDGTLTARVTSLSGAHTSPSPASGNASSAASKGQPGSQLHPGLAPWAKAGIILEPDTSQGTRYAAVMATGSHGVQMQYNYTHDSPGIAGAAGPSSPRWLRLTRAGDVITGYDSTDGARWTEIGTGLQTRSPVSTPPCRRLPPGNSDPPARSRSAGRGTSRRSWATSSPPSGQAQASSTGQSSRSCS